MIKCLRVFSLVVFGSLLVFPNRADAMGGSLSKFEEVRKASPAWHVAHPKVVVAFGLLDAQTVKRYSGLARDYLQKKFHKLHPDMQVEVVERATGKDVVRVLGDPSTVGFIFISHAFETLQTQTAISLGADTYPLPSDILSAASPALRFASFFGCYGPSLLKHYEVKYQTERLPGKQAFYYSEDKKLSANFLLIDNLKKVLAKEAKDLRKYDPTYFVKGEIPDPRDFGKLTIRVKDVYPFIEPRYVYVNGKIVGMLGSEIDRSNKTSGYEEFTYSVPPHALAIGKKKAHRIKILSSELTEGAPVDNYLIQSVALEGPFGRLEKIYQPAAHYGDREAPPVPEGTQFKLSLRGTKEEQMEQLSSAMRTFYRHLEWIDRRPEVWAESPLKGRFFIDDLSLERDPRVQAPAEDAWEEGQMPRFHEEADAVLP